MIMTTHQESLLLARDLTRVFQGAGQEVIAVNRVSLEIYPGQFVAFVGRSGSGKTTLLNLLAGLDKPTTGVALFDGSDLARMTDAELVELRRHKISFIFQSFGLLTLLSAYENVELPLRINGMGTRERHRRVGETLEQVGLSRRAHHRPYELSGGEQQRVAIARALVTSPRVIFADEPTGELDSVTGLAIARLLSETAQKQAITLVVATHDLRLAGMAQRRWELQDGRLLNSAGPLPA